MKILFASDLHGSASAAEKVLERLEKEGADRFFLLGDLLYHGPRNDLPDRYEPREVIRLLNESPIVPLCVRGNCDAEVDQMVLQFPIMADYALLPLDGGHCAFVTHGHLFNTECPPRTGRATCSSTGTRMCTAPAAGGLHLSQPRLRGAAQGGPAQKLHDL